jgi:hypothetical protein
MPLVRNIFPVGRKITFSFLSLADLPEATSDPCGDSVPGLLAKIGHLPDSALSGNKPEIPTARQFGRPAQ